MKLIGVQLTELAIALLDVIHVLHGSVQSVEHFFPVVCHHLVAHDCLGVVEGPEVSKVPPSPRVHNQAPG